MTIPKQTDRRKRWHVYVLRYQKTAGGPFCYYTGVALDVDRRAQAHKDGKGAKCLRGAIGLTMHERTKAPITRSAALRLEAAIKGWSALDKANAVKVAEAMEVVQLNSK
jgi:predicted GIY-YIG superfamily endonuclease